MDPTGRDTKQQRIKIIEAYFAAKSVLLTQRQCRKDFGRNNVPDGRTIQRLVAKFRKTDACSISELRGRCSQSRDRSSFGIIPENIQNLPERHEDFPENQHAVFHKKMAFQEHQF